MCNLVEEYAKDYAKEQTNDIAKNLISLGIPDNVIIQATHLTEQEVENLRANN